MSADLSALNAALFEQLRRMQDASGPEEVDREVARSKAVSSLAGNIIQNGRLMLGVAQAFSGEGEVAKTHAKVARALIEGDE